MQRYRSSCSKGKRDKKKKNLQRCREDTRDQHIIMKPSLGEGAEVRQVHVILCFPYRYHGIQIPVEIVPPHVAVELTSGARNKMARS